MKLTMTKVTTKFFCCLLVIIVSLGACKKDALEVKQEKEFVQVNAPPAIDPLLGTGIDLILKPDGTAGIKPGGDIIWAATYAISGNKITVKMRDSNTIFKFTVISAQELHGEHGEILKLVKS